MKKEMKKILALLSIVALVSCGGQQKPANVVKDSTWNDVVVKDTTNKQDTLSTVDTTSGLMKVAENVK